MTDLINLSQISLEPLTVSEGWSTIWPLLPVLLGLVIYSVFIFKFYRFVAKRDVFKLNLNRFNRAEHPVLEKTMMVIFYTIEYILVFPLFTFFWFVILTLLLSFMMEGQGLQTILLVSIALVGAVRICAYYSQNLSQDLAKMVPFALLSIFLLNINSFSFMDSLAIVAKLPSMWKVMLYYLLFVIALEFILRIGYLMVKPLLPPEKEAN